MVCLASLMKLHLGTSVLTGMRMQIRNIIGKKFDLFCVHLIKNLAVLQLLKSFYDKLQLNTMIDKENWKKY